VLVQNGEEYWLSDGLGLFLKEYVKLIEKFPDGISFLRKHLCFLDGDPLSNQKALEYFLGRVRVLNKNKS